MVFTLMEVVKTLSESKHLSFNLTAEIGQISAFIF